MIYPGGYKLRLKEGKDIPINVRLYKNSIPPEDILEMMYDVVPNSILEGPEEMDSPYYALKDFPAHERMYPSMMSPERKALFERKLREIEYEKEHLKKTKRKLHAKFIVENPDLPLVKDLIKTEYGQELLAEVAKDQPRQPETGTGENIYDEQQRDAVDITSVNPYQTKVFAIPNTGEEFSLLATERDGNGRIVYTGLAIDPQAVEREYEYDNGGRLSKVICENSIIEHYQYGKNGERLFAETSQTKPRLFKYGQNMELLQAGEVKYMYDLQGRMVMKNDLGQVTRYSYLESGPLHEVHLPDGRRIEYTCDPLGRRVAKSINGKVLEKYLWQDLTTLLAVTDSEGLHPKVFSYDEEGNPVSMTYEGQTFFFAANQLGTIFMVADERGNEVKRIINDSFGNLLLDSGVSLDICLGFAAGLTDKDTGLVHLGYREYDPAIGRFITPDPLGFAGGDVDVYGYCLDDPINFHDRTGLAGKSEGKSKQVLQRSQNGTEHSAIVRDKNNEAQTIKKRTEQAPYSNVINLAEATENPSPKRDQFGDIIPDKDDNYKNKSTRNETKSSGIAYNSEGKPITIISENGSVVPLPPGDNASAVKKLVKADAEKKAKSDEENTYGIGFGGEISGFGGKLGAGVNISILNKDKAVIVRDIEYGASNIIGVGGDIHLEKSNAKTVKDFEGKNIYTGVTVTPTLKGPSFGVSKSSNGKNHSTSVSIGTSVKGSKLIQPFETTVGRTSSKVLGVFDPTPDVLEKVYNHFK